MFPCGYSKMGPSVLAAERVKEVETLGSQGRRCFIFASPRASCPQGPGPGGCSCPCCHCCVSCVARSDWPQHCHGVGISRAPWQNSYGEGPAPGRSMHSRHWSTPCCTGYLQLLGVGPLPSSHCFGALMSGPAACWWIKGWPLVGLCTSHLPH